MINNQVIKAIELYCEGMYNEAIDIMMDDSRERLDDNLIFNYFILLSASKELLYEFPNIERESQEAAIRSCFELLKLEIERTKQQYGFEVVKAVTE